MTLEKKNGYRMCAAIGAATGAGMGIHRDFELSLGWLGALAISTIVAVVVALIASLIVNMIIKADAPLPTGKLDSA